MATDEDDGAEMSVAEIARELGVTRGAVHQVLTRGLRKVQAGLERRGFRPGDLGGVDDYAAGLPDVPDD
jgi:hypothetical protein